MSQKNAFRSLSAASAALFTFMGWSTSAVAEPPPCYADAPRVLPAPMEYGRAYRAPESTITYGDRRSNVSYRRGYSEPVAETTRVVTNAPSVQYEEPVTYARTYYQPTPEVYTYATPYYGSYGYLGASYYRPSYRYGHNGGTHYYRTSHHRSHYRPRVYTRHRSHRSYGRRSYGHRSFGHRSHRSGHGHHRSSGRHWGFSLGHSRGSHGGSSHGFSFHYGH